MAEASVVAAMDLVTWELEAAAEMVLAVMAVVAMAPVTSELVAEAVMALAGLAMAVVHRRMQASKVTSMSVCW